MEGNAAASSQNHDLKAPSLHNREVLHRDLGAIDAPRAKKPRCPPAVLTEGEAQHVLGYPPEVNLLVACPLLGSGLRLMECLRPRFKHVEFTQRIILVRDGEVEETG